MDERNPMLERMLNIESLIVILMVVVVLILAALAWLFS